MIIAPLCKEKKKKRRSHFLFLHSKSGLSLEVQCFGKPMEWRTSERQGVKQAGREKRAEEQEEGRKKSLGVERCCHLRS